MFASDDDIARITKRQRPSAQLRQLRAMGIDCRPDGDGKPLVLQSVVERWLGGGVASAPKSREPDFNSLKRGYGAPA